MRILIEYIINKKIKKLIIQMGKGLIFFCCSCCILLLTIVNLSIGPVISGTVVKTDDPLPVVPSVQFSWATANCKYFSDLYDDLKDQGASEDALKYTKMACR